MKRILTLMIFAAAVALTAPARATEMSTELPKAEVNSGFGAELFTNQSPSGFGDPQGSNAAVASNVADKMSEIAPAAGDDAATATPAAKPVNAGAVIAPAVSGETQPLSAAK